MEKKSEKGEVGGRVNLPNGGRRESDSRREEVESRRGERFSTLLDSGDGLSVRYR